MPTDEVIENKDVLEENTPVTGDGTDGKITADKGSADEPEQEFEQTDSDDGDASPAPSPDPLPDTDGDEPSEAPGESGADSGSDSTDSHEDGGPEPDVADGVEAELTDGDTDSVDDAEAADGDSADDTDTDTDTDTDIDIDTDTDDSETIGDVVTDSDMRVTVSIDLSNIDGDSGKPVSMHDGIHPEDDDTDRKSRVPRAVKVAAGVIATVAVTAALVTSTVAVMVVEIHPNVIGGETIASQQAGGIDGSGKKISVSYTVGDALNSSDDSDGPEILSWTDCWYTVAPGAKSVRAEIESAGKGSRIALSDGTSINVDGRYASKAGSFDAGIDIEGIAKLYGGDDSWVAIRYDTSHVLVGKRVAGGAVEGE